MFKFNSNHIVTGQIKQILNAFNLPSYKVYTAQHYKYFLDHGVESPELADGLYIRWDDIVEYKNGKWSKDFDHYTYNNSYPNYTRKLSIKNNIYDTETHEYLGEFLRFNRDYKGIDLMTLYNCFSNNVCNNIDLTVHQPQYTTRYKVDANNNIIYKKHPETGELTNEPELESVLEKTVTKKHTFYSKDPNFVVYSVPIKFFKQYTIAIDCTAGIEVCCGLYGSYIHTLPNTALLNEAQLRVPPVDMSQFITDRTYKKLGNLHFNTPILWPGIDYKTFELILNDCYEASLLLNSSNPMAKIKKAYKERILRLESDLRLFVKVPVQNKSSITILEGNYCDYNNYKYAPETVTVYHEATYKEIINGKPVDTNVKVQDTKQVRWVKKQNHTVTNYETQLFTKSRSTPNGYIVTELPEVEDRPFNPISPLQLLMFNTGTSYPFSDRLIEYLTGNVITEWDENADNIRRAQKVIELNNNKLDLKGAWEGKMRNILYDYMLGGKPTGASFGIEVVHDILGYVDKDVEKFYTAWAFETCRDADGNLIPLVGKIQKFNDDGTPARDPETGNYIFETGRLYKKVFPLLEAKTDPKESTRYLSDHSLLVENDSFLLTVKAREGANDLVPLYKQKYIPITTIQNVDIYGEEE